MRRIKALLFLAAVVSAIAAVSAPGIASATETVKWTHHTAPITESTKASFDGTFGFATFLGGFDCAVDADATLKPANGGTLDSLDLKKGGCEGNGALSGCQLAETTTYNEPYTLSATKNAVDISGNIVIEVHFSGAECQASEATVYFTAIKATPDNPTKISEMTLSGEGTVEAFGLEIEGEVVGTLDPVEPKAYGIRSFTNWTSSLQWRVEGNKLTKPLTVEVSGDVTAPSWFGGSYECAVDGEAILEAGTGRAYVTELEPEASGCDGWGWGYPGECEPEGAEMELGPLEAVSSSKLDVLDFWVDWQWSDPESCPSLSAQGLDLSATFGSGKLTVEGEYEILPFNGITEGTVAELTLPAGIQLA